MAQATPGTRKALRPSSPVQRRGRFISIALRAPEGYEPYFGGLGHLECGGVAAKPRVYSYLRFSDPKQAAGGSVDRQLEYAARWAADNEMELDASLSLRDEGLSAYHQRHVRQGALGVFLRAVEDGQVPAGSVLIVEGLDRLSRAEPLQAQAQFAQIVNAGIPPESTRAVGLRTSLLATDCPVVPPLPSRPTGAPATGPDFPPVRQRRTVPCLRCLPPAPRAMRHRTSPSPTIAFR